MLLTFLTFIVSMGCIQSFESSSRNQHPYLETDQVELHDELLNPFRASQHQDHLRTSTSKMVATAPRETETTIDGYILFTYYKTFKCDGEVISVGATSLNYCYNATSKYSQISFKYSFASPTSNYTIQYYTGDQCQKLSFGLRAPNGCSYGMRSLYSTTMTLPRLPAEPYVRSQ